MEFLKKHKSFVIFFAAGITSAIAIFLIINSIVARVTTNEFCGTTCHEMKGVYMGWQISAHHDNTAGMIVNCADCHLPPPEKYFTKLTNEAYEGGKNLYMHFAGPPYDANANRTRVLKTMPDSRCIRCHNNLLAKPSSTLAKLAHEASLNKADPNASRCVDCHAQMHERKKTL